MNVLTGSVNVVDALLFGGTSHATRDAIAREHETFMQTVDPTWGGKLLERTRSLFNTYNGAHVVQMVQNALNQVSAISRPDIVAEIRTIEDFQTAQPTMQSYIMANIVARKMLHANQCDGYSDTYIDPAPAVIGRGHEAYEHVMNGVVQMPAANDDKGEITYTNYARAWVSEDSEMLNIAQKAAVINTWFNLEKAFEEGESDPTSPWGASL